MDRERFLRRCAVLISYTAYVKRVSVQLSLERIGKRNYPTNPTTSPLLILPLLTFTACVQAGASSVNISPTLKQQSMNHITILRSHLSTMASSTNCSLKSTIKLNNGDQMPRIHLGVYMTSGRETSIAVTHALEAGYRGFDSAEWYANEREVGSAISKYLKENKDSGIKREDIWFTTKLKTNSGYEATRAAIMDSVWKSGLRYLDLYLLHSPYGGKERRLACWRAVEDAIEEGVVRAGGVSNFGVKHVGFLFLPFSKNLLLSWLSFSRSKNVC